jgi:hypothetical protein
VLSVEKPSLIVYGNTAARGDEISAPNWKGMFEDSAASLSKLRMLRMEVLRLLILCLSTLSIESARS